MVHKTIDSNSRTPWYRDWFLVPVMGIVFVLDQLTKYWVESNLCPYRSIPVDGPIQLNCSFNTGTAFGLFPGQTLILIIASIIGLAILLFIYRNHPAQGLLLRVSLGLQLGGAIGNLTDRLRFGQVTDFVRLGPWPVFNLADASIVIGVIILVWLFLFSGSRTRYDQAKEVQDTQTTALGEGELTTKASVQSEQVCGGNIASEQNDL